MDSVETAPNPVRAAIDQLGGLTATIVATGYSESTLVEWRKAGRIAKAEACFKFEALTGIPAKALAGLQAWKGDHPKNGRKRHKSGLGTEERHLAAVEAVDQGEVPPASEMQIPLGRLDAGVSRQIAEAPRIRPALCQVSEEGVAERMRRGVWDARLCARPAHQITHRAA